MGDKVRWIGKKVDEIIDLFWQARDMLNDLKFNFGSNAKMSYLTSYKRERARFNEMKF